MDQYNNVPWQIISMYFKDNPSALIDHHLVSYNDFFNMGIKQLFKEKNPIHFIKGQDQDTKEFQYQAYLYVGGKNADKFYYGKPVIYDENDREHIMYPNEARLRNMTYAFTIHVDLEVHFKIKVYDDAGNISYENDEIITVPKIYLGKFPIMLQSEMCILKGLAPEVRYNMGECRNDLGGYFIIDGKEKVIICQEKFADNTLYIQDKASDIYSYSAKIRSVSEDASKPIRTLAIRMVAEQPSSTNGQIVVSIPNVRAPVPLFIVMRALGVISDKDIIKYCLLDLDGKEDIIELFRPSVHDAGLIFTQQAALGYIALLTKGKSNSHTMEILMMYFLPHIGELNFKQKALYLGYIVNRLLRVVVKIEKPTNRDSYLYKRIEVSGILIYELFREYYTLQQKNIFLKMDNEHFYNKTTPKYKGAGFMNLILENIPLIFGDRLVENGFRRAFKGDWGSEAHTKRPGILQDLSRLSFWSFIAQLRKTNLHIAEGGAKVLGPRLLNSTQWGILCPVHTPDGGNIGFHKHMSIFTHISSSLSGYPFIKYLRTHGITLLEECSIAFLSKSAKVFVNGAWIGATNNIKELYQTLKINRRNGLFNPYISIRWNIESNELSILTDAGRPAHPVFHVNGNTVSYQTDNIMDKLENNSLTWENAIMGLAKKKQIVKTNTDRIYFKDELYPANLDLIENSAIIEYLDTQEMEGTKLAQYTENQKNYTKNNITHIEIHPSAIFSVVANQIIYPSNNQFPRNLFSCGQSKQAVSVFHTNYQNRMDKTSYFLNYGQIPIVKSRYLDYVTKEQHPYGINAIVAVMCYSGYNVEDAVIINKNALDRGLFRTTYLSTYEAKEESMQIGNNSIDKKFMDVNDYNVIGKKPGYDYSQLDPISGLIKENSLVNDKTIIIGMASNSLTSSETLIDESVGTKKGTIGYIDKSFMTRDESGGRIAKIRLRHIRIPAIGDKFASRAGQKGTIGIILDEIDMPTTADGIRPDIIVNPHAFPSRMTIGHLVESLIGKATCIYGGFGDCTAFLNKGPKEKLFGDLLTRAGFSSTGNEIMYNGMTGEQLETEIYLGPTYYMRLKHMVKDKINYRARGPRTVLTRQTVQGRANDGGLRIGEMDRDAVISHGMAGFLNESMMVRGDKYFMAICNNSGTIAVYNESRNLFLSPMVDGPLKFVGNLENELNVVPISRFGRNFSIVTVPYAFKLLYQELLTMNVQMRIITSDNVDQLVSLTKTNNIELLTGHTDFEDVRTDTYDRITDNYDENKQAFKEYGIEQDDAQDAQDDAQDAAQSGDEAALAEKDVASPLPLIMAMQLTNIKPEERMLYPDAIKHGFDADTVFVVKDVNGLEITLVAPNGQTIFAYANELVDLPKPAISDLRLDDLKAGYKVHFPNSTTQGYEINAIFEVKWIDDVDVTLIGPDGKILTAYANELELVSPAPVSPVGAAAAAAAAGPPYSPVSPVGAGPPYSPVSPVGAGPPYSPVSPVGAGPEFRNYIMPEINVPGELVNIPVIMPGVEHEISAAVQRPGGGEPAIENEDFPTLVYERGAPGAPPDQAPAPGAPGAPAPMVAKVIRRVKDVSESAQSALPLLSTLAEETAETAETSETKVISTNN